MTASVRTYFDQEGDGLWDARAACGTAVSHASASTEPDARARALAALPPIPAVGDHFARLRALLEVQRWQRAGRGGR